MSLDEKIKELEIISNQMDKDDVTIEQSIALFEKGSQLTKECLEELNTVKGKIYIIKKDFEQFREELTTKEMK